MTISVCPISKLSEMLKRSNPARVVSILDPGSSFPELGPAFVGRHLCLEFHDIHSPTSNHVLPSATHIDRLLRFFDRWDPGDDLLIHCRAGIGRSPATAFIAACYHNPGRDELRIASDIRRASPSARPNRTLIRLADNAMKRAGRMREAVHHTWGEVPEIFISEGTPFQIPSTYVAL